MPPNIRRTRSFMNVFGAISALGFSLLAVLVTLDVATRYFAFMELTWVGEVTEYLLTVSTFLGAPWVLHHHGHVSVDILIKAVPRAFAQKIIWTTDAMGLLISGILSYEAAFVMLDSYSTGSLVFKNLVFPEWYTFVPITTCFVLCTIEFASRLRPKNEVLA